MNLQIYILAQQETFSNVLSNFLDSLSDPKTLLATTIFALFVIFLPFIKNGPFILITLITFILTFGYLGSRWHDNTLLMPLELIRSNSRAITVTFLISLCVSIIKSTKDNRNQFFSFALFLFYVFQNIYLFRLFLSGEYSRSILGFLTCSLVFVGLVWGLGRRIKSQESIDFLAKSICLASLFFISCNILQLFFGYYQAVPAGRFMGISGNPQLCGFICSLFILFNCFCLSQTSLLNWKKYYYGIQIAILLLLIIWSGSRMSALSVGTGLILFYRFKILQIFGVIIIVGFFLILALLVFPDSYEKISRFTSGLDTRSAIWDTKLQEFYSSPIFGSIGKVVVEQTNASESSYLSTAGLMGISGLIPLAIALIAFIMTLYKCFINRFSGIFRSETVDLVVAGVFMILVASIFEGFLLGILSFSVLFIFILFTIAACINDSGNIVSVDELYNSEL
jgi:hypothetical protein